MVRQCRHVINDRRRSLWRSSMSSIIVVDRYRSSVSSMLSIIIVVDRQSMSSMNVVDRQCRQCRQ